MTIRAYAAAALYVATILAANYLTAWFGLVPAGFGLVVTAGTYAAGLALLARDVVQHETNVRVVIACIVAGGALSWWLASPALAVASVTAFTFAELLDLAVYTPLARRGWNRAVIASNIVGAIVDTFLFLAIASRANLPHPIVLNAQSVGGQLLVKIGWMTLGVLAVGALVRLGVRGALPIPADGEPSRP